MVIKMVCSQSNIIRIITGKAEATTLKRKETWGRHDCSV